MVKFVRINQYIQAPQVRVVDEDGKQVGVLPIFAALQKAREIGVDLVEVAPNAKPPVCKIIDFKKYKYLESKKEREERKGQKGGELKEIVLSPFIAKNDLNVRLRRIIEFLKENNKVKVKVKFRGREVTKKEFGYKIIDYIKSNISDIAAQETEARLQGKELFTIFTPIKNKKGSS